MSSIVLQRFRSETYLGCLCLSKLGCHARSVSQEEWKSPWEVTVDKFNEYFSKADEVINSIKSSQISRELEWVHLRQSNEFSNSYQSNKSIYLQYHIWLTAHLYNLLWPINSHTCYIIDSRGIISVLFCSTFSRKRFKFSPVWSLHSPLSTWCV